MGARYELLFAAYLTSSFGNWIYKVALPLLVLHRTGSALQTGAVYTLEYAPFLLLSIPGGVLADRFPRRWVLVAGDLGAGLVAAALALVVVAHGPLWTIYAAAFLLACAEPVYHPAFQSVIPEIAPPGRLGAANARLYGGDNLLNLLGPVLAGGLVALVGHGPTILLDAATFLVSAGLIALMGRVRPAPGQVPEAPVPAARSRVRDEIREAARYAARHPALRAGALLFAASNLLIWSVQANFVYYVADYHAYGPPLVGLMVGLQGAGALLGATLTHRLLSRGRAPGRLLVLMLGLQGGAFLLLVPARHVPDIGAAWTAVFLCGAVVNVSWFTLRQQITPPALLGRVVATTRMVAYSTIPLGTLAAGTLESSFHDMYAVFAVVGCAHIVMAFAASRTALPKTTGKAPVTEPVENRVADPE
ncbi:MFS transporter [Actinomadura logoneensis]|uniref:MFS transporter n=1 Tax=Actinomadura logoneensis TaxID=2293572 RepID=A0A372JC94_9ACTN|nr:MFS transporter [Actinomadura logoneensis]RFU37635.1 MFS transporter [Actinomadura logoneensis]